MRYLLYNMPFMDYIFFELSFLVVVSQVTFYHHDTAFNHGTKDAALDQLA